MRHSLALAVTLAAATTAATAQTFIPVPGTATNVPYVASGTFGAADEGIAGPIALGFPFTSPSGAMWTDVEVSSNGRLTNVGGLGGVTDFSPTLPEFLANPESLCPLWFDLDNSTVFVDSASVPSTTVITWQDATLFGGVDAFSFQVQISSTGQFTFVYDDRIGIAAPQGGVVGCTPGGGAVDPGESDFTDVITAGILIGGPTTYEEFLFGELLDLLPPAGMTSAGLDFLPAGPGAGYTVLGNIDIIVEGTTVAGRAACQAAPPVQPTLTFVPTLPGYVVAPGGTFDANFAMGTPLGLTDDSVSGPQMTSFMFPMPGGTMTNMVEVDSNGRVLNAGSGELSDFSPSVAEFLGDATPQIAPLWADLNPAAGGEVWFHDDGTGTSASVTWDGVPQFGTTSAITTQLRILPGGSFEFHYVAVNFDPTADNFVVGTSPGFGATDPGEADLSTGSALSATDVCYEFWDAAGTSGLFDLGSAPINANLTLIEVTPPVIGTNFDVDVVDSNGTAVAAVYFFGFPTGLLIPSIPLGVLGADLALCEMLTDIVTPGAVIASPSGTPGVPTTIFPIPVIPSIVGVSGLNVSAIVIDPTVTPALKPTDELIITIGNT